MQASSWSSQGVKGTSEATGGGSGAQQPAPPSRETLHPQPVSLSPFSSSLRVSEEAPEQLRTPFMGKRHTTHHIPPSEAATLPMGCEPGLERFPQPQPLAFGSTWLGLAWVGAGGECTVHVCVCVCACALHSNLLPCLKSHC